MDYKALLSTVHCETSFSILFELLFRQFIRINKSNGRITQNGNNNNRFESKERLTNLRLSLCLLTNDVDVLKKRSH